MNLKTLLTFKKKEKSVKEYGIDPASTIVIANDWMATGPMVEQVFPSFVITGNPQVEIMNKDPKIILSEMFSELTGSRVLLPSDEKTIHQCLLNKGMFGDLLSKEMYEQFILSKLQKMVNNGAEYVFPYQCFTMDFDFFEDFDLKVMGPRNLSIRDLLSNKVYFYEFLKRNEIEAIPGEVANDVNEAVELSKNYKEVYIAKERGAGGSASFHFKSPEEIQEKLFDYKGRVLVLKWLDNVVSSQNVFGIIPSGHSSPEEVAIISVSDQIIRGTDYYGNSFPCSLEKNEFNKVVEMSKELGSILGRKGYYGIFGVDTITVKENGDLFVYPVELNLRVNHSHGTSAAIYSRLRPNMPPAVTLHAAATIGSGWLTNKELKKIPIKPKEMKIMVMEVAKYKGWLETTQLPKIEALPVGFPPEGWLLPKSNIHSKSGTIMKDQPIFTGRLISTAEDRKEAFKITDRSNLSIHATYEKKGEKNVHDSE